MKTFIIDRTNIKQTLETRTLPQPAATEKWYTSGTAYNAHDQGLVIEEKTGKTIAVTYEQKNARMIAAAPEMLEALKQILTAPDYMIPEIARAAIQKASE